MRSCLLAVLVLFAGELFAQQTVTIPVQGTATIQVDVYGSGTRGLVLAHGGRFNKESWKTQAQAFANAGFLVVAVAFRGDRVNPDGSPGAFGSTADNATDVLAAVTYLRSKGVKTVAAIGGSMGGDAVGEADARSAAGSFDRIVLLGSDGGGFPEKLTGRKLFIVAREDRSGYGLRLPDISEHYARTPEPKKLVVLDGSAHAQFLFDTAQGPAVMDEILRFLRP